MVGYVEASGDTQSEAERALLASAEDLGGDRVFINPDFQPFVTHGPSAILEGKAYACEK